MVDKLSASKEYCRNKNDVPSVQQSEKTQKFQ